MPAHTDRNMALASRVAPYLQLWTPEDGYSPEYGVRPRGNIYGDQGVQLFGADGNPLAVDSVYNQLHSMAPIREPGVSLFNKAICGSTPANTIQTTDPIGTNEYRHFSLFVNLDSTGAPTTLQLEVLFWDPVHAHPHCYKQGLFASLFWEDTDTANAIYECFHGDIVSQLIGARITCVGGAVGAYFTVTASMEFWG